jgi:PAS domain S-box-containing protein
MGDSFLGSERRFRDILENVHLIAVCLDTDGKISFCNEFFMKMTGWDSDDILGRDWFETFLPQEHRDQFRLIFSRAISEGEIPAHYESLIVTPRGERKLVLWNNTVLFDLKGDVIGATCIGQDISETRRSEQELRRTYTEMAQLLAAIPSFLIGLSPDYRVIRWNSSAERTFGISGESVSGVPLDLCGIRWNRQEVMAAISTCEAKKSAVRLDNLRFLQPDGKEGFLDLTISAVKGDDGKPTGTLLLGSDVTKRKILESQLAQAQKLESIGQLAAGIAHEINTPTQYVGDNIRFLKDAFDDVSQVQARFNLLLDAVRAGNPAKDLIDGIDSATDKIDIEYLRKEIPRAIQQSLEGIERVARIVRAMKEFSHPGTDTKTNIDLNKAIESTITVARNEYKYVADMVTDLDPSLPPVPCLPGEFNQVILNMIINAAHAIAEKNNGSESRGTITISTRVQGEFAEIRIGDTGNGIREEIRSRIFDPFFTTKEVGKGTGQGLAISHSVIVDKHGGTIRFETEVGRGTIFIVGLPLQIKI